MENLEVINSVDKSTLGGDVLSVVVPSVPDISNDDGVQALYDKTNHTYSALSDILRNVIDNVENGNIEQNTAIASTINERMIAVSNNFAKVKAELESQKALIDNLDATFATDADREALKASLALIKQTLENTDADLISVINYNVGVLAKADLTVQKVVSVTSSNGIREFVFSEEIGKVFDDSSEIVVSAQVKGNAKAYAYIDSWSKDKAIIKVETKGTHVIPIPKNCSVENVLVTLTITHKQKELLHRL